MPRILAASSYGIGRKSDSLELLGEITPKLISKSASGDLVKIKTSSGVLTLSRVAGNAFECKSQKDFWRVEDSGKIVRLSGTEVDLGDKIAGADPNDPDSFIQSIIADLDNEDEEED